MSIGEQLKKIQELYTDNILSKGKQSTAVGWNTEDCQKLRFAKLFSLIGEDKDFNLLDYGCGYGSAVDFIYKDMNSSLSEYKGYDISDEMLKAAAENLKKYKLNCEFVNSKDIHSSADYVIVSGTFNVKLDTSRKEWEEFIENTLTSLNNSAKKGFSFNMLTSYVDWQEPHLYYGNPCFWFDFCKRNFSKYVNLIHDYPLWEWTITVNKGIND